MQNSSSLPEDWGTLATGPVWTTPAVDADEVLRRALANPKRRLRNNPLPPPGSDDYVYGLSKCGICIDQALVGYGEAALSIEAAVRTCNLLHQKEREQYDVHRFREVCEANIANVITNFAWGSSYVAYTPSFCQLDDVFGTFCAGDSLWAIGNVGEIMVSGFSFDDDCNLTGQDGTRIHAQEDLEISPFSRRLDAERGRNDASFLKTYAHLARKREDPARPHDIANCFFHVDGGLVIMVKTGINAWWTALSCRNVEFGNATYQERVICASNILNVISEVVWIINQWAIAAAACPTQDLKPKHAACTADISDTIAAIISMGSVFSGIYYSCEVKPGEPLIDIPIKR